MRKWQKALIILSGLFLMGATACSMPTNASNAERLVIVEKGDMAVIIKGSGNLETQREARLSFGTDGKIAEISCKEGERVNAGTALVKLEVDNLALAKKQSEVDLAKASVSLMEAKAALTKSELALKTAEHDLEVVKTTEETLKLALLNAQISLDQAKYNLENTQDLSTWSDIKIAQADVDEAERYLDYTLEKLYEYLPTLEEEGIEVYPKIEDDFPKLPGYKVWQDRVLHAQSRLNAAKDRLDAMQSGRDAGEVAIKKRQVEAAEVAKANAKKSLDDHAQTTAIKEMAVLVAREDVEQAKESVGYAIQSVELAEQSLKLAEKNLNEATIIAPFTGIVAGIEAKEGDTVTTDNIIVHLVDSTQLELIVEVDEIDIPDVALGQEVSISMDALPDGEFTGTVASIYPVPAKVTGLVMYNVRIALTVPESASLKIGMRATADIIVEKKTDVIKVPSQAVKEDGQSGHFVDVLIEKKAQQRPVTTGISNGTETEITSGLNEGETVVS